LQEAVRAGNLGEIARVLREDHEKKAAKEERLRRAEANPMDPENQRILEEHIRQHNIDESLNTGKVTVKLPLRVDGSIGCILSNWVNLLFAL
jgi:hypothetical protein